MLVSEGEGPNRTPSKNPPASGGFLLIIKSCCYLSVLVLGRTALARAGTASITDLDRIAALTIGIGDIIDFDRAEF